MKRTIDVVLGEGQQVGMLRYDLQGRRESAVFEYGASWLGDEDLGSRLYLCLLSYGTPTDSQFSC